MPRYDPDFCPYCGRALDSAPVTGGVCPSCDELVVKQPVVAAHVIVVDDDAVLVTKRAAGRDQGTWGFPGDRYRPRESGHQRDPERVR